MTDTSAAARSARTLLNKVPEVTIWFWVIKILATTVGETAADFLATNVGLGLVGTTVVMSLVFVVVLAVQFRTPRYVPGVYWLTVVLISVVGTLVTDNLTDGLGVPLVASTVVFAVTLAVTFTAWWARERTLSIHTIVTGRREALYWLAILFTFALGTAAGDLVDEQFGLGYWTTALLVAALIAAITVSHLVFRAGAVLSFWLAYILTRPLGASLGDGFSQARSDGGLGLGTTITSAGFLVVILAVVTYLAASRRDQAPAVELHADEVGVV
ncbi:MAG: COG4705 family protein [Blastococcus sp.]